MNSLFADYLKSKAFEIFHTLFYNLFALFLHIESRYKVRNGYFFWQVFAAFVQLIG